MIRLKGSKIKNTTLIPMCNLKEGQVAFVVSESNYVIRDNDRFLILGHSGSQASFNSWSNSHCSLLVRVLEKGETVTVEFSNE